MPLSSLLFVYIVIVVAWIIFSILIIGHLIKYGGISAQTMPAIITFICGAMVIFAVSAYYISSIDWQVTIPLFPTL